jgi:tRNA pseudouridine38-40 synthase
VQQLTGEPATVHGAGRTDSGVHAFGQSAHVRLATSIPSDRLFLAVNSLLPADVRVLGSCAAPPDFHARFSARGKRYLYRVRWGRVPLPVGRQYCHWWHGPPLDLPAMRAAARALAGRHDFAAMATNPGHQRRQPTVRTIHSIHLVRRRNGFDLVVQGDGFLYNMVRTMAGTLVEVGRGKLMPPDLTAILASGDRRRAGPTLPAQGLFLVRVLYPPPFCHADLDRLRPRGGTGSDGDDARRPLGA